MAHTFSYSFQTGPRTKPKKKSDGHRKSTNVSYFVRCTHIVLGQSNNNIGVKESDLFLQQQHNQKCGLSSMHRCAHNVIQPLVKKHQKTFFYLCSQLLWGSMRPVSKCRRCANYRQLQIKLNKFEDQEKEKSQSR